MGLIIAALIALGIVALWPILRRHRDLTSRRIPWDGHMPQVSSGATPFINLK